MKKELKYAYSQLNLQTVSKLRTSVATKSLLKLYCSMGKSNNCGIINHFAELCRTPKQRNNNRDVKIISNNNKTDKETVNSVSDYNTEYNSDQTTIHQIKTA